MTTTLHAQPYDISATGFFFETAEQYSERIKKVRNDVGGQPEEYEILFIDGESIDCELAKAVGLHQGNFTRFLELIDEWQDWEKTLCIIAVEECGIDFDLNSDCVDHTGIDIYWVDSLEELAEQFVEEGLYGDIPENLQFYLDYEKIARDLAVEYVETVIGGQRLVYRCG